MTQSSNASTMPPNASNNPNTRISAQALNRFHARNSQVQWLLIQNCVAACLLTAYTFLISLYCRAILDPSREEIGATFVIALSFLGALLSLRFQPRMTIILLLFAAANLQSRSGIFANFATRDELKLHTIHLATLAMMIYAFRARYHWIVRTLTEKIYQHRQSTPLQYDHQLLASPHSTTSPSQLPNKSLLQWIVRFLIVALALIFAAFITTYIAHSLLDATISDLGRTARWWFNDTPSGLEFWPSPSLIVSIIAIAILLTHLDWRRFTPTQAAMLVRIDNLRWQYPELKRLLARRRKLQREAHSNEDTQ